METQEGSHEKSDRLNRNGKPVYNPDDVRAWFLERRKNQEEELALAVMLDELRAYAYCTVRSYYPFLEEEIENFNDLVFDALIRVLFPSEKKGVNILYRKDLILDLVGFKRFMYSATRRHIKDKVREFFNWNDFVLRHGLHLYDTDCFEKLHRKDRIKTALRIHDEMVNFLSRQPDAEVYMFCYSMLLSTGHMSLKSLIAKFANLKKKEARQIMDRIKVKLDQIKKTILGPNDPDKPNKPPSGNRHSHMSIETEYLSANKSVDMSNRLLHTEDDNCDITRHLKDILGDDSHKIAFAMLDRIEKLDAEYRKTPLSMKSFIVPCLPLSKETVYRIKVPYISNNTLAASQWQVRTAVPYFWRVRYHDSCGASENTLHAMHPRLTDIKLKEQQVNVTMLKDGNKHGNNDFLKQYDLMLNDKWNLKIPNHH